MNRGRTSTASDQTGGPLDVLLDQLRLRIPGLIVERLRVTHPADDNNVYFIGDENGRDRVQLDIAPGGHPTFHVEDSGRHQTGNVSDAVDTISSCLE
jgi:hypothetical protein